MAARVSFISTFLRPHLFSLSSKFVFFREISREKSGIDTRDDSRVMKPRLGFLIFFFFFSTRKDGKEEREYWTGSSRDRQLDLESEIIFRWNAPHLVIAAQTRGRKFNKEQEEVGRVCVASEPVSFFSSSTQTKLFYLTSPSFCVSWLLPDRTVFSTVNARRARSRPPYSFTV